MPLTPSIREDRTVAELVKVETLDASSARDVAFVAGFGAAVRDAASGDDMNTSDARTWSDPTSYVAGYANGWSWYHDGPGRLCDLTLGHRV
jgi:hypothetical protein